MPLDPTSEQCYNKMLPAPLAFYSKKLSTSESEYSTFDRELFTAYFALRHFRFLVKGNTFILFTDHKPLTLALFRTSPIGPQCSREDYRSCLSLTVKSFICQALKML